MISSIASSAIFVLDQDVAKDFYVNKLGLECTADADMGFMRWLTVQVPGDPGRDIVLETPERPGVDPDSAELARDLVTKGAGGGWIAFATDDCRKTYGELKAKGVEFFQEPVEHFYGTDCALRDPFGNPIRILQRAQGPIELPEEYADLRR